MRPLTLKMKAFGSFAEETTVDFEQFTHGLYLIVGPTGAGKTTLFDGISFALFGVPSGSDRKPEMLHSDYVDRSVPTEVELVFLHQGRTYRVSRSIRFRKNRATGEYLDSETNATLWEPDRLPLEGASRVRDRCAQLLGMDAGQFKRVVMLAQGEFREFLQSDSDRKNEILGKLFDNTPTLRFQNLLGAARDQMDRLRRENDQQLQLLLAHTLILPEGAAPEDFLAGNPGLEENLAALVAREEQETGESRRAWEDQRRTVDELTRQEGAALAGERLREELAAKTAAREKWQCLRPDMEALQGRYARAEKALHLVLPREKALQEQRHALQEGRENLQRFQETLTGQQQALEQAKAAVDGDAPAAKQADTLAVEIARLEESLPLYERLREDQERLARQQEKLTACTARLEAAETRSVSLQKALEAAEADLRQLEGAQGTLARCQHRRDQARQELERLTHPQKGLLARGDWIRRGDARLRQVLEELETLTRAAAAAGEEQHRLYQAFLAGQAGLIARDLQRELTENGRAVCPVCHTLLGPGQEQHFAALPARTPTQAQVDEAARAAGEAEKRRQQKAETIESGRAALEARREAFMADLRELEPTFTHWETAAPPQALEPLRRRLEEALRTAEEDLARAQQQDLRREQRMEERSRVAEENETARREREALRREKDALLPEVAGLRAAVDQARGQLAFPEESAARQELETLRARLTDLQQRLEDHRKEWTAALESVSATQGALQGQREAMPRLEAAAEQARMAWERALEEGGFPHREAYEAALPPVEAPRREAWLVETKERLDQDRRDGAELTRRIAELEEQTRDLAPVDAARLQEELGTARERLDQLLQEREARTRLLENHRAVQARAGELRQALRETDEANGRIQRLAGLALGAVAQGGRLSFDRYVMGTFFREVLSLANRRLDVMTGGRFQLIHSTAGERKNAAAGLEIQVLDVATGRQRSAASLSGGESFLVSLALALGLSDAAQDQAGGRSLDTLFIDEGFGALDEDTLDAVVGVLEQLTEGSRLVGVISHVEKLEESIPQKLRVLPTPAGSTLRLEMS